MDVEQNPGARAGDHADGVAILSVEPGSVGYGMGLRDSDVIDSVNRQPVPNLAELRRALDKAPVAVLGVIRGDTKVQLFYRASY
jgi:S1-C subfamily serine protease